MPKKKGKKSSNRSPNKGGKSSRGPSNSTTPNRTPNRSPNQSSKKKPSVPLSKAEELKDQGNREFKKGHYKRAVVYYTRSLKEDEKAFAVYANRSAAYVAMKKWKEALEDANKSIELSNGWWKGYVRKSNVYSAQKDFNQAQRVLLDALKTCKETQPLNKALHDLDIRRISTLDKSDRIVGGHHAQASKFRKMFSWLHENGAKFPKLYLKFFSPEYRAINAIDKINIDEDVMYVPHACIMTSDVAKASKIGKAIIASNVELRSKHSYLASYLLQEREKGKLSKWYPYMDILPRTFETIPIFFGKNRRDMLKGSIALKKMDDRIESLRLEYDNICLHVPEFRRFPHADFVWARLVVITRIFGLVIDGVKTDGLVPMADMLNHKRPRETKWTYEQKRRGFVVTALKNIERNAEVFDSYGRKCNSRFFVNYGFSLEMNKDNEAKMVFDLAPKDPQYRLKAQYLGFTGPLTGPVRRDFQIPMLYKEKKTKECFSWLRIAHAQGNEFMIISGDGIKREDIPPLSIRNERMVLTSLAVAATRSLALFPDSLDHDNELLADEENYPKLSNIRNIILMRRGEKEVLHFYIRLFKEVGALLKLNKRQLHIKLKEKQFLRESDDPFNQYISNVLVRLI